MRAQVSLEAEINSVKHAKDIRREYEKQNQSLKDEVDQLRSKYKSDATAMQKLQDELTTLEKAKANTEFEFKQLKGKCETDKKSYSVFFQLYIIYSSLQIRSQLFKILILQLNTFNPPIRLNDN